MAKHKCFDCDKNITRDEAALCQKLLGVDTNQYFCIDCFTEYLACEKADLIEKIKQFKEEGCTLFL